MQTLATASAIRTILLVTATALACGATTLAQPFRLNQDDFPDVGFPGGRFGEPHLVVYDDGGLMASAAYRYSQRHHESRWLVVTLGLGASDALALRREDIVLVRPDGLALPPATERERSRDPEGVRRFLNERADWPETLRFNFPRSRIDRGSYRFEFGVDGSNRAPDRFIRTEARGAAVGDVFFVSPDGSWRAGVHALVVTVGDDRIVRLPVLLQ